MRRVSLQPLRPRPLNQQPEKAELVWGGWRGKAGPLAEADAGRAAVEERGAGLRRGGFQASSM